MAHEGPPETPRRQPGSGRRGGAHPKGRAVVASAIEEVKRLLGGDPPQRSMLIEYLHRIQDTHGGLSTEHIAALADCMRLALTEVYEVATFYAHFDVLYDGEPTPPALTVRVCESLSCHLAGSEALTAQLQGLTLPGVRVLKAPCMGRCAQAPAALVGRNAVGNADIPSILSCIASYQPGEAPRVYQGGVLSEVSPVGFEAYVGSGGYRTLRAFRDGSVSATSILDRIEAAGLRGLGGAGFKTAQKWRLVQEQPAPRFLAVNADEGEPGTFKDRHYLEIDPHRFLEGTLIAAHLISAERIYIYLRDEYPHIHALLHDAIHELKSHGYIQDGTIELRRGAGAYICGEETAMLESIEGKRGYPRHKPPFPTQVGLFGRPTLINNVETLYWVRDILEQGPEAFAAHGRNGRQGMRSFSVSGRVKSPGVKRAPAGITARELIEEYCGGMLAGHKFKGYLPGGASGGILPAAMADIPLDFGTLEPYGCFIGSAAVIVFSDHDNARDIALNLMRFFEHESCGQCTPCRCGTEKAVALMSERAWDGPLLHELSQVMRDASICGLGQAAPNPLLCVLKHFPEDL